MVAPLAILALGVVGFLVFKSRSVTPPVLSRQKTAPQVDTVVVRPFTESLTIRADGQVVPYREVVLSSEVAGRVIQKTSVCRAGKYAQEGDLLIEIDPSDYLLEKRQLTEQREQASIALDELEVEIADTLELIKLSEDDLELQEDALQRELKLIKSRATSEAAVDQARRSLLAAPEGEPTRFPG